tara:strand:+ start:21974 stop:22705 length:732 start_codon:yes stop_codon:yes gene_type:complete
MNINLKPNQQRAQYALWILLLLVLIKVVAIVTFYLQYHLLDQWMNGAMVDMDAAEANDRRVLIVGLFDIVVRIATIIAVILWFRRAYFNLHLRFQNLTYSEGWAAGGWFVPFMSLVVPYQIFNDLFTQTKQFLKKFDIPERNKLNDTLLITWWLVWICNTISQNIFKRFTRSETDVEKLANYTLFDIGFTAVDVIALVMLIAIVKAYSEIEPIFHSKLDEEKDQQAEQDRLNKIWETDPVELS